MFSTSLDMYTWVRCEGFIQASGSSLLIVTMQMCVCSQTGRWKYEGFRNVCVCVCVTAHSCCSVCHLQPTHVSSMNMQCHYYPVYNIYISFICIYFTHIYFICTHPWWSHMNAQPWQWIRRVAFSLSLSLSFCSKYAWMTFPFKPNRIHKSTERLVKVTSVCMFQTRRLSK